MTDVKADDAVRRILGVARSVLGLEAAYVSTFVGDTQVFTHVVMDADGPAPAEGSAGKLPLSYCLRVLAGRMPALLPDVGQEPEVAHLAATTDLGIGAYAAVPVADADGAVVGMLCCTSSRPEPGLRPADLKLLAALASALAPLLGPAGQADRSARAAAVLDAVAGHGRTYVLQPLVDVRTGTAVGVEALSRFEGPPGRPDLWFAEAESVGLLLPMEVAAAESALSALATRPGHLSLNLSPSVIVAADLDRLFAGVELSRILLEITEHAAVADYEELAAVLAPYRQAGLRLAIDDAGAGFASFRHILQLRPDVIKVDLSLVRDIHLDPARQALTSSLLAFARTMGAQLVAEGVETQDELDTLARLGITLMQGYFFSRPVPDPPVDGYPLPSRHVVVAGAADLAVVLAEAVRDGHDLEHLTRPLLEAVLGVTGLETSYLTVLRDDDALEHRFVRNAGGLELPEGFTLAWSESLCSSMQARGLRWTDRAAEVLDDRPAASAFGVATFITTPVLGPDGGMVGTLCAASRRPVFVSDATLAQLQLISHVLAGQLSVPVRRQQPLGALPPLPLPRGATAQGTTAG